MFPIIISSTEHLMVKALLVENSLQMIEVGYLIHKILYIIQSNQKKVSSLKCAMVSFQFHIPFTVTFGSPIGLLASLQILCV